MELYFFAVIGVSWGLVWAVNQIVKGPEQRHAERRAKQLRRRVAELMHTTRCPHGTTIAKCRGGQQPFYVAQLAQQIRRAEFRDLDESLIGQRGLSDAAELGTGCLLAIVLTGALVIYALNYNDTSSTYTAAPTDTDTTAPYVYAPPVYSQPGEAPAPADTATTPNVAPPKAASQDTAAAPAEASTSSAAPSPSPTPSSYDLIPPEGSPIKACSTAVAAPGTDDTDFLAGYQYCLNDIGVPADTVDAALAWVRTTGPGLTEGQSASRHFGGATLKLKAWSTGMMFTYPNP